MWPSPSFSLAPALQGLSGDPRFLGSDTQESRSKGFLPLVPRSQQLQLHSNCTVLGSLRVSQGHPPWGSEGASATAWGRGDLARVGQPCSARALRVHSPCQLTLGFDEPSKGLQIFSPWNFAARSPASSLVFRAAGGLVTRVRQEVALASPRTSCSLFLFGAVHVIRHTRL